MFAKKLVAQEFSFKHVSIEFSLQSRVKELCGFHGQQAIYRVRKPHGLDPVFSKRRITYALRRRVKFLPAYKIYYPPQVRVFFKKSRIAFQHPELDIKRLFFKFFYGITPASAREEQGKGIKQVQVFFHFRDELLHPAVHSFHYPVKKSLASVLLHEAEDSFINIGIPGKRT